MYTFLFLLIFTLTIPDLPFCFMCCADAKGLSSPSEVELLREKVYASLEAYCKQRYPDQQGRYCTFVLLFIPL